MNINEESMMNESILAKSKPSQTIVPRSQSLNDDTAEVEANHDYD